MKKLVVALGAAVAALGLFGGTLNVPSTEYPDIATAVAAAKSGDEIVIAKSATPYVLAKKITLPTGVTVRGETGDFNDVVISGGGKLNGAFVVGINCAVSNITFTSFVMTGSSDAIISETGSGARYVDNCRFTANSGTSYGSVLISNTQLSTYSRIVVDNCQLGHQCQSGLLCIQKGTFTDCVITNNYVQNDISGDQMPDFIHVNNNSTATLKNSFIGYNDYGTAHGLRIGKGEYCGAVKVSSGTLENCVIVGNEIRHASPQKVGAVWRNGGSIKNCIILENGLDADDWVKVGGSSYSYCLSTDTGTMKTSVDGDWNDIVAKPGELPWIPYGSRAIGAGEQGGDIGRIWTPATLKCAVKQDKRQYTGAATANLLALASAEATFAWTLVSGAATLTPDGKNATLAFDGPGTAVVRVTATSASETATDEVAVVSTPAVYEVATTAELEAAVDVAQDGAEIVLAANTYTPAKTLVLKNAVTVRGATGNRADVVVDGNSARRVFTLDHPGASIASLTVKRGNAEYAAGIMMEAGGLLTNVAVHTCKITGWKGYYNADAQWYFCGGGGVANFNGKVLDCDISNHQRANYWSGITAYGQHGPYALGDRLTITNNTSANTSTATSGNYRSVPVVLNGGGTIRNAFIAYNDVNILNLGTKVQDACGILVQDGTLENSTIFRNRVHANYFGYAAGLNLESKGSVVNCLITENGDANGNVDNYRIAAGATFDHCATAPVPAAGTGCVDYSADPMTIYDIDAVGYPVPKPETPTVDAGADLDWTVEPTAVDLFGNLRKQGELTDIGAYEKKPSTDALLCELTVVCDAVSAAPYDVTLGAIVSGSRKTGLSYTWSAIRTYLGVVTTNTVVTTDPAYVFTDLEKGDWAFALTVTNDHEPPDVSSDETDGNVIHLSPEICYVSPTGLHVWPYDTPATASTNFIDVVAEARGRIVVLPGAYENLPHVTDANGKDFVGIFEHAVTIEGPDDPRAATINCDGLGGFKLANKDVKLSGVAFTNFAAKAKMDGDSSALTVAAGLASNVVVDACNRPNRQKGNYVNIGPGAMLTDSLVTGAKSDSWGGGNVLVNVGGTVRNCSISNNNNDHTALINMGYDSASQKSARLEGCVITNNTVANGIVGCTGFMEDCLVAGNKSKNGSAILTLAKSSRVRRCRILRNTTSAACVVGPGWCYDANSGIWSPAFLENCLIAENSVSYAVAQSDNTRGAMTLVNMTVANNTCTRGGVFYGNNVKDDGTAIQYPNRHCMTNCILCANVVGSAVTNIVGRTLDGYFFVGHNCYSEAVEDDGNFNTAQDPQLRAFGRKIYQPKSSSPCVATGDAWFWTEDDVDVAGNPRLRKGAVDMGCYEPLFPGLLLLLK